ncbi:MFS transporter [Demequina activiva]|uniref:MFS transporter n=1 Tax=Demequina activiva TaxID=1582364 RepID=UPI001940CFA5|nr:MFS transporter [Demequina activiva]
MTHSEDDVRAPEDVPVYPTSTAAAAGEVGWVPSEAPVSTPVSPRRANAALVALGASAFIVVTNEIAPLGLINRMATDLDVSPSTIGYLTTVFAIVVMVSTVPLTLLTTRLPRRALISATMAFWTVGVVVVATAGSFAQLMGGRVITAMGHALFWAIVTPAAAGMFAPEVRGRSVSRLMLGASGAGVIGLPAATWIAQSADWRVPFVALGVAGVVLAVAIAILMPSAGSESSAAARGDFPSLRRFLRVLTVALLTTGAMSLTWTYITPYFVDVSGFAESSVPALLALGGAVGVIAMWLVGRFLDRWPVRSVAVGQGLLAAMWLGLALLGGFKAGAIAMIVLQGFAWSILVAAMVNWAMRHTPWKSDIGVGAYASTFNAGNAVGSVVGASLLAWVGAQWLPVASLVLTLAAAVLVWLVAPEASRALARRPMRGARSAR